MRTVLRRPRSDRWCAETVKAIRARPRMPNPEDEAQNVLLPEKLTKKMEVGEDGSQLKAPEDPDRNIKHRDFKITREILDKHGYTAGCKACDATLIGESRHHDEHCRRRFEELVKNYDVDGLHYDYIRYPREIHEVAAGYEAREKKLGNWSYDAVSLARFSKETGVAVTPPKARLKSTRCSEAQFTGRRGRPPNA